MSDVLQLVPREAQLLLYLRWIQELRGLALPRLELLEEGGNGRIEGARAVEYGTFGPGKMRQNARKMLGRCWKMMENVGK